jgi:nitroreductase
MDAIEAMQTCKAVRWFKPDPVPEELIHQVLEAANCAPSPGNSQGWHFVVIRDRSVKQKLSDAFGPVMARRWTEEDLQPGAPNSRMYRGVVTLAKNLAEVPALILVAGRAAFHEKDRARPLLLNSLYGVTQNLLVAARSLGLGTTLTMFHEIDEDLLKQVLNIPEDVFVAALIPLGWPDESFTKVKRHSLDDITHWDGW